MWKRLRSFFRKHPRKRRIDLNRKKDYEYLLHVLGLPEETGFINLDVADVDTLRGGEAVFLWESAIAASAEEAIAMAKKAAENMAPTPGSIILVSIVQVVADYGCELETIVQIASPIVESFSEDVVIIFGVRFSDEQKGIRFVLATSEGQADTGERENGPPAEGKPVSKPFCINYFLESPALEKSGSSDEGETGMRIIFIDSLTLLVGGTRLEREREMGNFQSVCNFAAELTKSIRTGEADRLTEHWSSVPAFMLSEVQEIDGKQETERVLSEIISRRRRMGLPTTLGMDTVPVFMEKGVLGPSPIISKPECTEEELFDAAVEAAFEEGYITVAMLECQFNTRYGYTVRLIDKMEMLGIVGPPNDPVPRQLRMSRTKWEEIRRSHHAGKSVYGQRKDDFLIENGCLSKYKGRGGDVVLPEGIEEIGKDAFFQCTGLTGIYIPDGVAKIGMQAFMGCFNLKRVSLPVETIREIGPWAFSHCAGLTEIEIPWNVTEIDDVFGYCASLESILIPDLVMEIGVNPFAGCTNLNRIFVMPGNNMFSAQGGALFRDGGKELICCPAASGEYHIPESVVRIGVAAFCGCRDLTGIIIPEGVKEIGEEAFRECTGLTEVTIPSSVEEIKAAAFEGCRNLTSVTIQDEVKKIGRLAFARTGLPGSVRDHISKSVMELGEYVFLHCWTPPGKRRPGTDQFS